MVIRAAAGIISLLKYIRFKLRKANSVLAYGKYTLIDKDNPDVYAYTRELDGKIFLVVLNFKNKIATLHSRIDFTKASLLLNNYKEPATSESLRPYEARVYNILN